MGVRRLAAAAPVGACLLIVACGGGGKAKTVASSVPGVPVARSGADGQAAARAARAYILADGAGKGARTCKLVAAAVRARLNRQRGGCAKALSHPPVDVSAQRVSSVQITRPTALVAVTVPGGPTRQIGLQRERGAWRVANGGT